MFLHPRFFPRVDSAFAKGLPAVAGGALLGCLPINRNLRTKTTHFLRIQTPHVTGPAFASAIGRPASLRASLI